jgi:hypothetical protein
MMAYIHVNPNGEPQMHIRNKPPAIVPDAYRHELEELSKAALMDLAWALGCEVDQSQPTMDTIRHYIAKVKRIRSGATDGAV